MTTRLVVWFLLFLEKEIEAPRNANDLVQVQQLWCYIAGGLTTWVCLAPKPGMFPLHMRLNETRTLPHAIQQGDVFNTILVFCGALKY